MALSIIVALCTCMVFAQVKPFNNPDRFSKEAVLLDIHPCYPWLPPLSPAKYLFMKWGVTFDGEKGAVTFVAGPLSSGPPQPGRCIISNGISEGVQTELPLVIESDFPLNRIGFILVPHDGGFWGPGPPQEGKGVGVPATTTITAFDDSGRVLGSVVEHEVWAFVGLEVAGPEPISRLAIKSDHAIEGIRRLMVEYVSRPQFITHLPQLANGGGLRSSITFLNLSDSTAGGTMRVYDSAGVALDLGGLGESAQITLAPRASKTLATNGDGGVTAGYGMVTSDCPLQVQCIYTTEESDETVREAGVVGVSAGCRFIGAVVRESESGLDTAIAVVNPNAANETQLDLIDADDGMVVGSKTVQLPARGQLAIFISELFPQLVGTDWQGSVRISSSEPVAVIMIRTLHGIATSSFPVGSYY